MNTLEVSTVWTRSTERLESEHVSIKKSLHYAIYVIICNENYVVV